MNAIQIRHRDKRGHATEKVRRVADSNRSNRGRVRPARTPPRMQEKGPVVSRDKARVDQSKAATRRAPKVNSRLANRETIQGKEVVSNLRIRPRKKPEKELVVAHRTLCPQNLTRERPPVKEGVALVPRSLKITTG